MKLEHPTVEILERVAVGLIDSSVKLEDPKLDQLIESFHQRVSETPLSNSDPWQESRQGPDRPDFLQEADRSGREEMPSVRHRQRREQPQSGRG